MKIEVDDLSGGDYLKARLVSRALIFLDGVQQETVVRADEEEGMVEVYVPRDDPRWSTEYATADYWPTEFKYGRVEIKEGEHRAELVMRLRRHYSLEEVDADDVMTATKGLLGRALIEFKMAWRDFWREVLR